MGIIKDIFKVFNGSTWDEHYLKTSSDQVVHTKSDGTATTVQQELLEQNSALSDVRHFETIYTVAKYSSSTKLYAKYEFSDEQKAIFRANNPKAVCVQVVKQSSTPYNVPATITTSTCTDILNNGYVEAEVHSAGGYVTGHLLGIYIIIVC